MNIRIFEIRIAPSVASAETAYVIVRRSAKIVRSTCAAKPTPGCFLFE
jgi:hypothetical protein